MKCFNYDICNSLYITCMHQIHCRIVQIHLYINVQEYYIFILHMFLKIKNVSKMVQYRYLKCTFRILNFVILNIHLTLDFGLLIFNHLKTLQWKVLTYISFYNLEDNLAFYIVFLHTYSESKDNWKKRILTLDLSGNQTV